MLEGSSWSRQRLVDALEALSSMEDWVVEVFSPSSSSELEELMVPYSGAADSRDWEPHALQWSLMIKSSDYYPQCWKILLQLPLQRLIQCVASFAPEHKTSVSFNLFCSSKQPMTNKSSDWKLWPPGKGQDPHSQIKRQTHHNNHLFICDFHLEVDQETQ